MMRVIVMQSLGYGFLVLGVIGVLLPVLQGSVCFVIGLAILSRHAPWAERLMHRLKRRFPRIGHLIDMGEARAEAYWERITAWFRRWMPSRRTETVQEGKDSA
jgi:uncharacterized membrane protein YbaN (DUF454 family)